MLNAQKLFLFCLISFLITVTVNQLFNIPYYFEIIWLQFGLLLGLVNNSLLIIYQIVKETSKTHFWIEVLGKLENIENDSS